MGVRAPEARRPSSVDRPSSARRRGATGGPPSPRVSGRVWWVSRSTRGRKTPSWAAASRASSSVAEGATTWTAVIRRWHRGSPMERAHSAAYASRADRACARTVDAMEPVTVPDGRADGSRAAPRGDEAGCVRVLPPAHPGDRWKFYACGRRGCVRGALRPSPSPRLEESRDSQADLPCPIDPPRRRL